MTSEAKIRANRLNALKSRGPKTDAGKQTSSRNALKHGLLGVLPVADGENSADYAKLYDDLVQDLEPKGCLENIIVEKIAADLWRLRRGYRIEIEAMHYHRAKYKKNADRFAIAEKGTFVRSELDDDYDRACETSGGVFCLDAESGNTLEKLSRYETAIRSRIYKNLAELRIIKQTRLGK
jgi:hypothetical protein